MTICSSTLEFVQFHLFYSETYVNYTIETEQIYRKSLQSAGSQGVILRTVFFFFFYQGLGDRKKKHAADKKKFEEELEELRSQQEVSECLQ